MKRFLWPLQIIFGVYFVAIGVSHFFVPANLPPLLQWMYDLPPAIHAISGTAEILGGLGLILPGLTGIETRLTPLAAAGLALVMGLAAGFHIIRAEYLNVVTTLVSASLLAYLAWARWRIAPLPQKRALLS